MTPEQALNHPTWKMGQRITIDSATLMNKGFEVIEACWLFDFPPKEVEVVVHPQSKVHAMVEYTDGSVIAQISATDMRMPIQYALTYPERARRRYRASIGPQARALDVSTRRISRNFPLLKLAYQAQEAGGSATCTLNAADEIAVEAFLAGKFRFRRLRRRWLKRWSGCRSARSAFHRVRCWRLIGRSREMARRVHRRRVGRESKQPKRSWRVKAV